MNKATIPHPNQKEMYWKNHVQSQVKSGLNVKMYCAKASISCPAFKYWQAKFREKELPSIAPLIPVKLEPEAEIKKSRVICTLKLREGHCLEFYSDAFVKELLQRWL